MQRTISCALRAMNWGRDAADYTAREILLAAAAQAVLAAFRDALDARRLPASATATLRVLETALEPYRGDVIDTFPYNS
ncbi:hypothetical protein RCO27_00360 [Sphingosinicella sp. LHD-64]|uniref:hypothetical protein n=1 Tax=Sphingosinicella sp. LHD-64 TaxID=3072139 RepID=UPI0028101A94|nr:hypothetical protein [Sphingosinicella sp. LHD-64]MDQ8754669.1 hypothetical protein [Sphingosinicella sp. LHD-64]